MHAGDADLLHNVYTRLLALKDVETLLRPQFASIYFGQVTINTETAVFRLSDGHSALASAVAEINSNGC